MEGGLEEWRAFLPRVTASWKILVIRAPRFATGLSEQASLSCAKWNRALSGPRVLTQWANQGRLWGLSVKETTSSTKRAIEEKPMKRALLGGVTLALCARAEAGPRKW